MKINRIIPNSLKEALKYFWLRNKFPSAELCSPIRYDWDFRNDIYLGKSVRLRDSTLTGRVSIGDFSDVSASFLYSTVNAPVSIGNFSLIASECFLSTCNQHQYNLPMADTVFSGDIDYFSLITSYAKPVAIGHNVWLGRRVFVMPGVKIGNGAIIGAGAVVTKDVPPFSIWGGVPAKSIKMRFEKNVVKQLEEIAWWFWDKDKIVRNRKFFFTDLNKYRGDLSDLLVD